MVTVDDGHQCQRASKVRPGTNLLLAASLSFFGFAFSALAADEDAAKKQQQPPPPQVGVVQLQPQKVPRTVSLPGRAVAYESVAIRPRVDGVIQEVLYEPGKQLKAGDPLFQLDDASNASRVAADKAEVGSAEANLPVAQAAYNRMVALRKTASTQSQIDQAKATLADARARRESARAALKFSEIQLSWTTIRTPIDGVAEVRAVSVGDLVTSGQTEALTTVTRLDPIDVDMLGASSQRLSIRNQIEAGTLQLNETINATLKLENGDVYKGKGSLVDPGNTVSRTTGTVSTRFRFENPEQKILPGMFLRGTVDLGTIKAILVPQRAATRDGRGQLSALFVDDDDMAVRRQFQDSGTAENSWIVIDGIDAGDRVIVDGLKSLKAGTKVTPVPATIDADGLVQDTAQQTEPEQ